MVTGELRHITGCTLKFRKNDKGLWFGRFFAPCGIDRGQAATTKNFEFLVDFLDRKAAEERRSH